MALKEPSHSPSPKSNWGTIEENEEMECSRGGTHLGFEVIPNKLPEKVFSYESHPINSVRTTGQPEVQISTQGHVMDSLEECLGGQ